MKIHEAVKQRIINLAAERNITMSRLSTQSGITRSALQYIVAPYARVKNVGIVSIQKMCQAFGITIQDFFADDLFQDIEFEED